MYNAKPRFINHFRLFHSECYCFVFSIFCSSFFSFCRYDYLITNEQHIQNSSVSFFFISFSSRAQLFLFSSRWHAKFHGSLSNYLNANERERNKIGFKRNQTKSVAHGCAIGARQCGFLNSESFHFIQQI